MDQPFGWVRKHRDGSDWLVWDALADPNPFPLLTLGGRVKRSTAAICECGWTAGPHRGVLGAWLVDLRWWLHRRGHP
jgi:hypothetical protein